MPRKSKKKIDLELDSDSEINVNDEYARRFEHNKLRDYTEKSKHGNRRAHTPDKDTPDTDSQESSEDELGDLVTERVDEEIQKVIRTIREEPGKLLDTKTKFFQDSLFQETSRAKKREKPMLLKDYHRINLLGGIQNEDESRKMDNDRVQRDLIVREIHGRTDKNGQKMSAVEADTDTDSGSEGGFRRKTDQRAIEPLDIPDVSVNDGRDFLDAYLTKKAWIEPDVDVNTGEKRVASYSEIVEDSDEFDDVAEKFETAYNFRFEDPSAAEIVSYARTQNTLRREKDNVRRRQREKRAMLAREKAAENNRRLEAVKQAKVNAVSERLLALREAVGETDFTAESLQEMLDGDYDESEWDKRMLAVVGGDKPGAGAERGGASDEVGWEDGEQEEVKQRGAKSAKTSSKKLRQEVREAAKLIVEQNMDLTLEESQSIPETKFRYRQVSPDAFGLTATDILVASDKQLNEFAGLKRFAAYKEEQRRLKDKNKYAKKRRLKEWRRAVFASEEPPCAEDFARMLEEAAQGSSKGSKRKR